MTRAPDPATEAVTRRVWARRLGVPTSVFDADEVVLVNRPDLTAAVVVRMGTTIVVAAPDAALSDLRRVARDQLLDVAELLRALAHHGPALVGAATLSFADRTTMSPVVDGAVSAATDADAGAVLSMCSHDEREESGLAEMSARSLARDPSGRPVALAGYDVWDGALAQMGVAAAPESRSRGFGERVARAAVREATDAGLVPQWRSRLGNLASTRLRDRLGFVQLGEQIAIDLGVVQLPPAPR